MAEAGTITSTGIAKLAGVGRAAVSNWRRRYADFPQPVGGTSTGPVFELVAVQKWLSVQGKLPATDDARKVWREIEAVSGGPDLGEALWLAGLCLLRRPAGDGSGLPTPDALVHAVREVDESAADLFHGGMPNEWSRRQRAVVAAAATLASKSNSAAVFEDLFSLYVATRGSASDHVTPPAVATLMLTLAGPADRVLDAACGTGALLMEAIAAHGGRGRIECFGQDANATAARITQIRLLLAMLSRGQVRATVRVGDSLRSESFPRQLADLVVSNPPFGLHDWADDQLAYDPRWEFGVPPRTEPELAWVQDALAHLEPGGLAVLLMPPGAAWRSAGRRIRAELLRRGALRAVIGLPPRLVPATSVGLQIWILRRPRDGAVGDRLLVVDTTAAGQGARPDIAEVIDTAVTAWRAFDRDPGSLEQEQSGVCRSVPVIDLLDEDVDVSPARHLAIADRADLDPAALLLAREHLKRTLDELSEAAPSLRVGSESPLRGARYVSVNELARTGGVHLVRWPARPEPGSEVCPAVTGTDVMRGDEPTGEASADGRQVEPGDVLVPTVVRSVIARVATEGQVGARLGQGVYAVRPDPRVLDPWYLAGMLSAPVNAREATRSSSVTAGATRVNVKRLQVPLLPIEEQARYGAAFRRLAEFDRMLTSATDQGRELARSLSDALSNGTLAPE